MQGRARSLAPLLLLLLLVAAAALPPQARARAHPFTPGAGQRRAVLPLTRESLHGHPTARDLPDVAHQDSNQVQIDNYGTLEISVGPIIVLGGPPEGVWGSEAFSGLLELLQLPGTVLLRSRSRPGPGSGPGSGPNPAASAELAADIAAALSPLGAA